MKFSDSKSYLCDGTVLHAEVLSDENYLVTSIQNGRTCIQKIMKGATTSKSEKEYREGVCWVATKDGVYCQKGEISYEQN